MTRSVVTTSPFFAVDEVQLVKRLTNLPVDEEATEQNADHRSRRVRDKRAEKHYGTQQHRDEPEAVFLLHQVDGEEAEQRCHDCQAACQQNIHRSLRGSEMVRNCFGYTTSRGRPFDLNFPGLISC